MADALAERLANEKLWSDAVSRMLLLTTGRRPSGSSGTSMMRLQRIDQQTAWRQRLAEHGADIEAGKTLKPSEMPKALFGNLMFTE